MIDPRYAFCLTPGPGFKPEVFCTDMQAKHLLTPEEAEAIQELVVENYFNRLPGLRADRRKKLAAMLEGTCLPTV